ncbi:MBL fold metallo-hydrolase [Oceanicella actignis]|uniref:Glyoxylase, beta-lactamase superfamily II n=1 Tax=Oceanicella actignis TaxID=1189325 RepID=A0A1M7SSC6_9RHOB|nr:MBL fold metallo-hydrolase [Oceanicella actignis]SES68535.1 Glyoxylase, beta-lactamase superfamily II [Oceanicella actignis]SHN61328.1 Glyoxylase, beta-lactamase superfamily II [Oceanicella actignis]
MRDEESAELADAGLEPETGSAPGVRHPFETPPAPGEVIEVAPGVLWARMPLPMRLDHVNVYALDDGDGWTVVDAGFRGAVAREAWSALLDGPLAGRPLRRVVVTHHHPDHIGMAGWLMRRTGAELWTTRTAYLYARMLQLDHHDLPPPENVRHMIRCGAPAEVLERYRSAPPFNFSRTVEPLPIGFRRIQDGERVAMGGRRWIVRVGAGHAPEHATFWSEDDALVLTGDQIIPGISSNLSVFAMEPDADPVGEWLESCERLRRHAREEHFGLPGHKLPFTGLPARLGQLIDNHHAALERLRPHLARPRAAAECFMPIFRREIEPEVYGLALSEALAHLNHLWRIGEAERVEGADGVWRYRLKT